MRQGRRREGDNAKAQRPREEEEKGVVVARRSRGCREWRKGGREGAGNAKAERRREEEKKGLVLWCGGKGILPMRAHGRDARATSKAGRLPPEQDPFPLISEALPHKGGFCLNFPSG